MSGGFHLAWLGLSAPLLALWYRLIGKPVTPQDRTGLIWHTQGSGKSLTMIFAGYKLRQHPKLKNPTVLIVVDRRDLKTQLSEDFDACDYPNVEKALGVEDLKRKVLAFIEYYNRTMAKPFKWTYQGKALNA